ncbi:dihydrolipoamide succinyltransferase [Vibrio vulnificus]|nr:dihydrolipoamide succinyltransferase [Vibrio vulnificus]
MEFFMSGETEIIFSEEFRLLRNEAEQKLKSLENNDYGNAVEDIGIIPIIVNLTPEIIEGGFFKERVKFSKKNKDADIRMRIDYHDFLNGDLQKKKELLLKNIIESVRALGQKVKKDFDSTKLERDIIELFKSEV